MEAEGCIIPDVNNVKNTWKGQQRGVWRIKDTNHVGNRVRMLDEDDYGAISKKKLHKDAHGTKRTQLKLSKQMFNCDDVKGVFDKDRKIDDGICGMKMLKQKMREKNWKDQKKTREEQQKLLKFCS